jgi:hypothetical protein
MALGCYEPAVQWDAPQGTPQSVGSMVLGRITLHEAEGFEPRSWLLQHR